MSGNKSILIVDDDKTVRDLLSDVFGFKGFAVYAVSDGISALRISENIKFDVIITDYAMPNMNGFELAKILRFRYPDALIIGISADCNGNDFLRAGADVFLRKPFTLNKLLSIMRLQN